MATTLSRQQPTAQALAARRLPKWAMPALAVAVGLVSLLLFATTGLAGTADFVVFVVFAYLVAQTAVSFGLEGRRQAVNRFFSAFVYGAFALAALPLLLILWYTVRRGIGTLDLRFLTISM